jgi:hypothetical protein
MKKLNRNLGKEKGFADKPAILRGMVLIWYKNYRNVGSTR